MVQSICIRPRLYILTLSLGRNGFPVMSEYVYTPGVSVNYFSDSALTRAIRAGNYMRMLGDNNTFSPFKHLLEDEVGIGMLNQTRCRDGADKTGKISFCLMVKTMGVGEESLVVDPAQAGGLLGRSDGAIVAADGTMIPIEIKGTRSKKGKKRTFQISGIRLTGTDWQHLFIVGREEDPDLWTDASELARRGFWLGHVTRGDLLRAAWATGRGEQEELHATVTPGSSRSWLGGCVRWVSAADLSPEWWDAVLQPVPRA